MAIERKVSTLRLPPELYAKVQFLAYKEQRSFAKEIEHIVYKYAEEYESKNGSIPLPDLSKDN